ncbi:MAG: HAD family hydrolase [Candidatus Dojkabacteria bacterium]|jgi:FMN phosphatase YigB (HAD superfamily)
MNKVGIKENSIFTKGSIENVIFDLDDTLFQTGEYYKSNMLEMAQYISKLLDDSSPESAERIYQEGVAIHKEIGHPMLLNKLMKLAIAKIYGDNLPNQVEIDSYLDKTVELFYKGTPRLKEGALHVLDMLDTLSIRIGIHSHSQPEWTESKVRYIQNEFKEKYGRDIQLLFHSTSIEEKKDIQGWEDALKSFGFNPNTTLVVGDNLKDDILPTQELGVRVLVLISNSRYSSNAQSKSDKDIIRIENIENLCEL